MSNRKSFTIAIIMVAMLVIILVCMFLLKAWAVCGAVIGLLAALGLICATNWLVEWMKIAEEKKEDPIDVDPIVAGEPEKVSDFEATYDSIRREVAGVE